MTHDNYPQSSSNSYEKEELAAARRKLVEARQLVNYLDTRWYDYEKERREAGRKSEALRSEIIGLTGDLEEALSYITAHIAPMFTAPSDLFAVAQLRQEVEDSINRLQVL